MLGVRVLEVHAGKRRRSDMRRWMRCEWMRVQRDEQRDERSGMNANDGEDSGNDEQMTREMSRKMDSRPWCEVHVSKNDVDRKKEMKWTTLYPGGRLTNQTRPNAHARQRSGSPRARRNFRELRQLPSRTRFFCGGRVGLTARTTTPGR